MKIFTRISRTPNHRHGPQIQARAPTQPQLPSALSYHP